MDDQVSSFQRRMWAFQRAGWVVLSGLLILAGLGAAGGEGPFNRKTLVSPDSSLEARYRPMQRAENTGEIELLVRSGIGGTVTLELDRSFRDILTVSAMVPEPERTESSVDGYRFVFQADERGSVLIRMAVQPRRVGRYEVQARVPGHPWTVLSMTVLP